MAAAARRAPRLSPGAIASRLLVLEPDRDERAPQLCAEMLLTLVNNKYAPPADADSLVSPKRQEFATRSLALGENFLAGRGVDAKYGEDLARAHDTSGAAHLHLAQQALEGLVDPDTRKVQRGGWLLRPFHESLLWYDARRGSGSAAGWTVRKVHMRGTGITLARMLLDPPEAADAPLGAAAVAAIREALQAASPLADIAGHLRSGLNDEDASHNRPPSTEDDEKVAWTRGGDDQLAELASRLCRHAEGVMSQNGASGPARLWQLRSVIALDIATHIATTAWAKTSTPPEGQFLLLSFGDGPRPEDPVRQRSEDFYKRSRLQINAAIVQTLAERMQDLHEENANWAEEFEARSGLGADNEPGNPASQLRSLGSSPKPEDYERIARSATEMSAYDRGAGESYRRLLESVGMIVGTGAYRYLTATPELLGALVGALSARMPMSSRDFFAAIRSEWGLVVNQESASASALTNLLDGAKLERNARKAEKLMSDAGLALGLSDRTTVVGERAARRRQ